MRFCAALHNMIFRTRFKRDIVCEFLPPARPSGRVIIFCGGMPGAPRHPQVLEFWAKKGFWVFFPRYRGTWESDGEFLKDSPEKDMLDIIEELPRGFSDLWSGNRHKVRPSKLYIFGASFGGPAAILLSRDPRVTKAIALSPAIDWRIECTSVAEPMDKLGRYLPEAFGNAYRFSPKNWRRLMRGEFYNPIDEADTIIPEKLLVFFAKDDEICSYPAARTFAKATDCKLITLRTGGHFGFSKSLEPKIYKEIKKFLK